MPQIGNIPEINDIKECLDVMKEECLVQEWELPYEYLLTRRTAAIFFLSAVDKVHLDDIWQRLDQIEGFEYMENTTKTLSNLDYQITFK